MNTWIKLGFLELWNNRRFSLFFILNLTFGLIGFIALDSFKISLANHIHNQSKQMLAADLKITATRPLVPEAITLARQTLGGGAVESYQIRFFNMTAGSKNGQKAGQTKLVEVVAVDANFPLYGSLVLSGEKIAGKPEVQRELIQQQGAWAQPELLHNLGYRENDRIQIGKAEFLLTNQLLKAPGQNFWNAGIAYKIYIGMPYLQRTGLLGFGSRKYHEYLFKLPAGRDAKKAALQLQKAFQKKFGAESGIRIQSHSQASEQMGRSLKYLSDYLSLVSLVALFLAGIGTAFLFRAFLRERITEIAILKSLGATHSEISNLHLLMISILGTLSALLACASTILFLPLLSSSLQGFLPYGFETKFSVQSFWVALGLGVLGSLFFCLPILQQLKKASPALLFQGEGQTQQQTKKGPLTWLSYLPIVLLYWFLGIWQAASLMIGSAFIFSLFLSVLLLWGFGYGLLKLAAKFSRNLPLTFKLALQNLYRGYPAALSSFVAIGVGALLLNLIPQLHQGLQEELKNPDSKTLPQFFAFDIQQEQLIGLRGIVQQEGAKLQNPAAMVAARLTHINGLTTNQFWDQNNITAHVRRLEVNLSFRNDLYPFESIQAGNWWEAPYHEESENLPEISLESRYAKRYGLQVGDEMTFHIFSIPFTGQVTNLRKVNWNNFTPNFMLLFQPGVLEDAPTSYLANINQVQEAKKTGLLEKIQESYPNISLIDVSRMVQTVIGITTQINWALQSIAYLAIFAGMVVVYSIARYNGEQKKQEINLLKVVGAGRKELYQIFLFEFGVLGFLSALVGATLSIAIAWGLSQLLFDHIFSLSYSSLLISILGTSALSIFSAWMATRNIIRQKPLTLLQAA